MAAPVWWTLAAGLGVVLILGLAAPQDRPDARPAASSHVNLAPNGSARAAFSDPWGPDKDDDKDEDDSGGKDKSKDRKCDPLDIECKVSKAIDDWLRKLAKAAIKAVFKSLATSLLQTPRVDEVPRVAEIWRQSVWIANTCFVLLVMAGGVVLLGHETVQTSYAVKDIAPRLVVAFVAVNFSAELVGWAIDLANGLAAALAGPGVDAAAAMKMMGDRLSRQAATGSIFIVLVVLTGAILAITLALIYVLRLMLTILRVVGGPIALACHALPQTEGLAKLWWRALAGVLAIQVGQALVFIVAVKVLFTPDGPRPFSGTSQLWDALIVICLLYVLIRIPSWISRQVFQGNSGQRSPLTALRYYVLFRLVR